MQITNMRKKSEWLNRLENILFSPRLVAFVSLFAIAFSLTTAITVISEHNHLARFCSECKAFHLEEEMTCEENRKQVEEKINYWKEKFDKGHISEAKFQLETIDYLENLPRIKWWTPTKTTFVKCSATEEERNDR